MKINCFTCGTPYDTADIGAALQHTATSNNKYIPPCIGGRNKNVKPYPREKCSLCHTDSWMQQPAVSNINYGDYLCTALVHPTSQYDVWYYYKDQLKQVPLFDDEQEITLKLLDICAHSAGQTPLQNPTKGNKLYVICKKCGDDIEEWKVN